MNTFKFNFNKFFVACAILVTGCIKESALVLPPPPPPLAPTARFVYMAGQTPYKNRITFINTSIGATSYNWDFGDNTSSTDSFPVHTYASGGNYTVKLTAYNAGGSHTSTETIFVANPASVMRVTSVVLNNYSASANYDAGSYADVYLMIGTTSVLLNTRNTTMYLNTNPAFIRTWTLSPFLYFTNPNESFTIAFWDYDEVDKGDADDIMDSFVITPEDFTQGANAYPSSINLTGKSVNCTLNINWQ